jgi:hypothetical protein
MKSLLKKLSVRHKNNKLFYYTAGIARMLLPSVYIRNKLNAILSRTDAFTTEYIRHRLNYYNKLSAPVTLPETTPPLSALRLKKTKGIFFRHPGIYPVL